MTSAAPIGVFDSGIGGLTVVHELMRQLPGESIIYFGDTARVPYGPKSPETVRRYSLEIMEWLLSQGVKALVVACNTSTAHAKAPTNCVDHTTGSASNSDNGRVMANAAAI